MVPMQGKALGAYQIEEELGSGGMGTVWLARDEEGLRFAVKVIHSHLLESPGFFKRFLREAEIGKAVRHPNVVRCYDADARVVDGRQQNFLVMEYVEGQTLRALLEELDRVPEELCRHIGREVAKGLSAIHEAGVVHRDLKPENVLITPDHEVKIMDLGVARLADEAIRLSQSGAFVGSIHYAAPEQFKGGGADLDGRADLHALGLILYELSSGTHPYLADDVPQVLRRVLNDQPRRLGELNPQLSAFFEEVSHTLIEKDREKRFNSAKELLRVLTKGEESTWWRGRANSIRAETKRPLRRIRIPRETAVYGREDELAKLRTLYEKARDGDGQVVLIEGEAGIGKTRLFDELIRQLQRDGEDFNFLFGSYPPGGAATVSGAWSTAYREQLGAEGLADNLEEYLAATPALIPAFAALLRGEPPPEGKVPLTKDAIQTAFRQTSHALAAERTTIVLIEDLHFSPEEGRALFAALAASAPGHRLLIAGAARPSLPETWLAELDHMEHATRLRLQRLGPKDLAHLLIDVFHSERLADEIGFQIARKSDGNPFFVFEIIRGLRERKLIRRTADGAWESTDEIREIEIPSSVLELVQARISVLDEDAQELLDVAACCGLEFDPEFVGEILGLRPIPVLRAFGRLERSHRLVRSSGSDYVFDHSQIREAVYQGLSEQLRRRYHESIARAIEERHPEPDGATAIGLCTHYLDGGRGESALRHLDAALDHLRDGYLRDQVVALIDRVTSPEGLVTGTRRGELLLRQSRHLSSLGRRSRERATLTEALELARAQEDKVLECRALANLGMCWNFVARYEKGQECFARAVEIARDAGATSVESWATGHQGTICWDTSRYRDAERYYRAARDLAKSNEHLSRVRGHQANLAGVLGMLGRYEDAMEIIAAGLVEPAGDLNRAYLHDMRGLYRLRLGRFDEARRDLEEAVEIARRSADLRREMWAAGALACLHHDVGHWGAALGEFDRCLHISREMEHRQGEAGNLGNRAFTHIGLGAGRKAGEGFEAQLEMAREDREPRQEGHALQGLGLVAESQAAWDRAHRHYEAALGIRQTIEYPRGIAQTLLSLARIELRLGDRDKAAERVRDCTPLATDLGEPGAALALAMMRTALEPRRLDELSAALHRHRSRCSVQARMAAAFALWQGTEDSGCLKDAHSMLEDLRDHAPEEYRETMIANVPLHRDIMAAWGSRGG